MSLLAQLISEIIQVFVNFENIVGIFLIIALFLENIIVEAELQGGKNGSFQKKSTESMDSKVQERGLKRRITVLKKTITEEFVGPKPESDYSLAPGPNVDGSDYTIDDNFVAARSKPGKCKQYKKIKTLRKKVRYT